MSTFSATFRRPAAPDLFDGARRPWVEPIPGEDEVAPAVAVRRGAGANFIENDEISDIGEQLQQA